MSCLRMLVILVASFAGAVRTRQDLPGLYTLESYVLLSVVYTLASGMETDVNSPSAAHLRPQHESDHLLFFCI